MRRILGEPLLHFLLIGAAIFGLFRLVADPSPTRSVDEIIVTQEQVARLAAQFEAVWRRPPTAEDRAGLIEDYIREEVYYREALAYGLDRDDTVIRRRLRQKMEFLAQAGLSPDEATLREFHAAHPEKFTPPARVSFDGVYLGDNAGAAPQMLAALRAGADPKTIGRATLLPPHMESVPQSAVDGAFGAGFFAQVAALPPGEWSGPAQSSFGLHLVRLNELAPAKLSPFDAARERVAQVWAEDAGAEALEAQYQALRGRYKVTTPDRTPDETAGAKP